MSGLWKEWKSDTISEEQTKTNNQKHPAYPGLSVLPRTQHLRGQRGGREKANYVRSEKHEALDVKGDVRL